MGYMRFIDTRRYIRQAIEEVVGSCGAKRMALDYPEWKNEISGNRFEVPCLAILDRS